ncbi:MAG: hypothetical protein IJ892_00530 [Prevotella sp.]|nr:hypothetical protein [Prevotella sp.]
MMKRVVYILTLSMAVSMPFCLFGCSECEEKDPFVVNREESLTVSPLDALSSKFFDEQSKFFDEQEEGDSILVLNSYDELVRSYKGNVEDLPSVDWKNHTVVVGKILVPSDSHYIKQLLLLGDFKACLVVCFAMRTKGGWLDYFHDIFFWETFPKVTPNKIEMIVVY